MTEAEWLRSDDPQEMLVFLWGKASDRKLRLFAVACCRRIWRLLPDQRSRHAVEVAERYADTLATEGELETASDAADSVWDADIERASTGEGNGSESGDSIPTVPSLAAFSVAIPLGWWGAAPAFVPPDQVAREVAFDARIEGVEQCRLLRDIFGNPFRQVTIDPAWLTPEVVTISRMIYEGRAFDRMPILGDALEDAGCTDAAILGHCRGPGPHTRGCWVVDAILGKT